MAMTSIIFLTVRDIVTPCNAALSQKALFSRYISCQVRCPRGRKNSTGYFGLIIFNVHYVGFSETPGKVF